MAILSRSILAGDDASFSMRLCDLARLKVPKKFEKEAGVDKRPGAKKKKMVDHAPAIQLHENHKKIKVQHDHQEAGAEAIATGGSFLMQVTKQNRRAGLGLPQASAARHNNMPTATAQLNPAGIVPSRQQGLAEDFVRPQSQPPRDSAQIASSQDRLEQVRKIVSATKGLSNQVAAPYIDQCRWQDPEDLLARHAGFGYERIAYACHNIEMLLPDQGARHIPAQQGLVA